MDSYLGEIRMFAGNYAPEGWQLCDGTLLQISEYEALYTLLGTVWGGDGQANFAVPDFRGRLPIGQGAGPSLTPRTLGAVGGQETATINQTQMPSHSHGLNASGATATALNPGPTVMHAQAIAGDLFYAVTEPTPNVVTLDARSIAPTGGGYAHDNMMPCLALNYIICTAGVFPQRP